MILLIRGETMKPNSALAESPDHSHYTACLTRMDEIAKFSRNLLSYAAITGAIMILLTVFTLRLPFISLLPSLIGESTELGPMFVQILIIIAYVGLALLGWAKYKIANILLFIIYIMMIIFSIFVGYGYTDILIFIIGIGGLATSLPAFSVYADYEQLKNTEGFPLFNTRLKEYDESMEAQRNRNFPKPEPIRQYTTSEPVRQYAAAARYGSEEDEMPSIGAPSAAPDIPIGKIYLPEGGKVSRLSDSPMKF